MKKTKNKKQKMGKRDVAIRVEDVYKSFKIPHEKHNSLKSVFLNLFKKKSYSRHDAAKGISFEVKKGEFLGIIGRNGCGKSTMLKMLAGIYLPDRGKITVEGRLSPFLELGVGFNPELTARDNVYLNGAMLGLTRKEINEKFNEIISFAELEEFVDQRLKNFSSGMQVRLAFSVAIQAHADILLIDEVLAVGDESFQRKCLEKFGAFKKEGKTVVFVSHTMDLIRDYCDRAILIEGAEIITEGDTDTVTMKYEKINMTGKVELNEDSSNDRAVKITNVEAISESGSNVIKTGDQIDIKIKYKVFRQAGLENLNFNVGLHAQNGGHIFSYGTLVDKVRVSRSSNQLILRIKSMPLLDGYYDINVNCFGDNESDSIDFGYKVAKFKVSNIDKKYKGLFSIDHQWEATNE
jgi:ABC-2 type transport system ATP-binding protein